MGRVKAWNRQTSGLKVSHNKFASVISNKYGPIRRGVKSGQPLIFKMNAAEGRKATRKSPSSQVIYRTQTSIQPTAPATLVAAKKDQSVDAKNRFIDRDRLVERERVVEREKIIDREKTFKQEKIVQQEKVVEREKIVQQEKVVEREKIVQQEKVVEREKIVQQEKIVKQEKIVQQEKVVERKVIVVREVDRIIIEQRKLRELAINGTPQVRSENVERGKVRGRGAGKAAAKVRSRPTSASDESDLSHDVADSERQESGKDFVAPAGKDRESVRQSFAESIGSRVAWPLTATVNAAFREPREVRKTKLMFTKASVGKRGKGSVSQTESSSSKASKGSRRKQENSLYADVLFVNRKSMSRQAEPSGTRQNPIRNRSNPVPGSPEKVIPSVQGTMSHSIQTGSLPALRLSHVSGPTRNSRANETSSVHRRGSEDFNAGNRGIAENRERQNERANNLDGVTSQNRSTSLTPISLPTASPSAMPGVSPSVTSSISPEVALSESSIVSPSTLPNTTTSASPNISASTIPSALTNSSQSASISELPSASTNASTNVSPNASTNTSPNALPSTTLNVTQSESSDATGKVSGSVSSSGAATSSRLESQGSLPSQSAGISSRPSPNGIQGAYPHGLPSLAEHVMDTHRKAVWKLYKPFWKDEGGAYGVENRKQLDRATPLRLRLRRLAEQQAPTVAKLDSHKGFAVGNRNFAKTDNSKGSKAQALSSPQIVAGTLKLSHRLLEKQTARSSGIQQTAKAIVGRLGRNPLRKASPLVSRNVRPPTSGINQVHPKASIPVANYKVSTKFTEPSGATRNEFVLRQFPSLQSRQGNRSLPMQADQEAAIVKERISTSPGNSRSEQSFVTYTAPMPAYSRLTARARAISSAAASKQTPIVLRRMAEQSTSAKRESRNIVKESATNTMLQGSTRQENETAENFPRTNVSRNQQLEPVKGVIQRSENPPFLAVNREFRRRIQPAANGYREAENAPESRTNSRESQFMKHRSENKRLIPIKPKTNEHRRFTANIANAVVAKNTRTSVAAPFIQALGTHARSASSRSAALTGRVQEQRLPSAYSPVRVLEPLTAANMILSTGTEDSAQSMMGAAQQPNPSLAHVTSAISGPRSGPRASATRIHDENSNVDREQPTSLELRRNVKETLQSDKEKNRVEVIDKPPEINAEQLQKAISSLPQLNPDQLADQVYKSLMKRMKFEQSLRGY